MTISTTKPIKTKFGNASIGNHGYYYITSRKGKNSKKLLHRLIFEDFYNINLDEEFPEGVVIHHHNEDKLCNEIWNLVPMSRQEHANLHKEERIKSYTPPSGKNHHRYGKNHSKETKIKISESKKGIRMSESTKHNMSAHKNTSGFYCVSKKPCPMCNQGFSWIYQYYDENMKHKTLHSVNLLKLKKKVVGKGLVWKVMNEDNAKRTCEKYDYDLGDLM